MKKQESTILNHAEKVVGVIPTKDMKDYLSQVGSKDPVTITLSNGRVRLNAVNLKKDFELIESWGPASPIYNNHDEPLASFSLYKEVLSIIQNGSDQFTFTLKDENQVMINGSLVKKGFWEEIKQDTRDYVMQDGKFPEADNLDISAKSLEAVLTHCSQDNNRYIYHGVCVEHNGKEVINLIATDGRRMAVRREPADTCEITETDVISYSAVKAAVALAKKKRQDTIQWNPVSNDLIVIDTTIKSEKLEGCFPDWQRVLPDHHVFTARFESKDFEKVLKDCIKQSDKPLHRTEMVQSGLVNEIRLIVEKSIGSARDDESIRTNHLIRAMENLSSDFCIAFNASYMLDAVRSIGSDMVVLKIIDETRPIVIEDPDGGLTNITVVMPIKL